MFCQVEPEQVVAVHDVSSTYHVPLLLDRQGHVQLLRELLKLDSMKIPPYLLLRGQRIWEEWKTLTTSQDRLFEEVNIALVGKYTNLQDSYISVIKSLEHASLRCNVKLDLHWVDASDLEAETLNTSPVKYHTAWKSVCSAEYTHPK